MNETLEESIKRIIDNFFKVSKLFTSLDITNQLKCENKNIKHKDVANLVRLMFVQNKINHKRTLIDVNLTNGLKAKAYLYHKETQDPSEYKNRNNILINEYTFFRKLKSDCRLEIPQKIIKTLGWKKYDLIYAYNNINTLSYDALYLKKVNYKSTIGQFIVDKDNRVRVPKTILKKCNFILNLKRKIYLSPIGDLIIL